MPTVAEIEDFLETVAPPGLKESFDNVGFLVGESGSEVHGVLVSLDITGAVVEEAEKLGAELIVSHHPVIFHPLKRVTDRDEAGRLVLRLVRSGISAICMHTNLDAVAGGVNDALAERLGLLDTVPLHDGGTDDAGRPCGIGRAGRLEREMELEDFARQVKERLGCNGLRFSAGNVPVRRVAVGGGACGEFLADAAALGCDTFVTADVKYNVFLAAGALGVNLIDAGHFPTEDVICAPLAERLRERFPALDVTKSRVHREIVEYM